MGYDRNPEVLFRAIQQLKEEVPGFAEDFELRLYGQVDHRVRSAIEAYGLLPQTNFAGSVDRRVALQETLDSHVLLLLLNQQSNAKGRIPGKLFEYLAARRPVLNFGLPESDVAEILRNTGSGQTVSYTAAPARAAEILREAYAVYQEGGTIEMDDTLIKEYSHPRLVKQLAGYLDSIAA